METQRKDVKNLLYRRRLLNSVEYREIRKQLPLRHYTDRSSQSSDDHALAIGKHVQRPLS